MSFQPPSHHPCLFSPPPSHLIVMACCSPLLRTLSQGYLASNAIYSFQFTVTYICSITSCSGHHHEKMYAPTSTSCMIYYAFP
ncbi:hypothetical protein DAEQUDRAFT_590794 [Daedalea quercina L-15889]|uniref:Uncharacterized protein n=1 Tax=Daedalea quercina L-15889 TaxID=1314783 RepID=A0A165SVT0_9APHY|nr:hypothetical protein DAEQUDRAFT_590794 [Daedalea quercina L-15889]